MFVNTNQPYNFISNMFSSTWPIPIRVMETVLPIIQAVIIFTTRTEGLICRFYNHFAFKFLIKRVGIIHHSRCLFIREVNPIVKHRLSINTHVIEILEFDKKYEFMLFPVGIYFVNILGLIFQLVPVAFRNKDGRNRDVVSIPIISHSNVFVIFVFVIFHNDDFRSCLLGITHFLNK